MSVMDAFKQGQITTDDIADAASKWKDLTGSRLPLRENLGMSRQEYADWLNLSPEEFKAKYWDICDDD